MPGFPRHTLKVSVPPAVTQLGRRGRAFELSKTFKLPSRCIDAPLAQLRTATLCDEYTVSKLWQIDSAAVTNSDYNCG